MKITLEYDNVSGYVTDAKGMSGYFGVNAVGFTPEPVKPVEPTLETQFDQTPRDKSLPEILEMIRQGVSAEDLVKLKNCGVI